MWTRLRRLRKNKGISQAQLAERVGVSRSAICQIEKGKTNPSMATLMKVMQVLDPAFDVNPLEPPPPVESFTSVDVIPITSLEGVGSLELLAPLSVTRGLDLMKGTIAAGQTMDFEYFAEEQRVIVVEGEVEIRLWDNKLSIGKGENFFIRKADSIKIKNIGDTEAQLLFCAAGLDFG